MKPSAALNNTRGALKNEERELIGRKRQFQLLQKQITEAQDASKNRWLEHVSKAIGCDAESVLNPRFSMVSNAYTTFLFNERVKRSCECFFFTDRLFSNNGLTAD